MCYTGNLDSSLSGFCGSTILHLQNVPQKVTLVLVWESVVTTNNHKYKSSLRSELLEQII